jgi:hypothetical protein
MRGNRPVDDVTAQKRSSALVQCHVPLAIQVQDDNASVVCADKDVFCQKITASDIAEHADLVIAQGLKEVCGVTDAAHFV